MLSFSFVLPQYFAAERSVYCLVKSKHVNIHSEKQNATEKDEQLNRLPDFVRLNRLRGAARIRIAAAIYARQLSRCG